MEHELLLMDIFLSQDVVPHFVSYAFLTSIILIVISLVIRKAIQIVPTGFQNFMEVNIEFILNLAKDSIGHHWYKTCFPILGTLWLFILICNYMGIIPGFTSPTSNINVNAAMALPVFFFYQFTGFRAHGIKYINHFLGPIRSIAALPLMILMFVIELIGHCARPLTLSVRLFGNMVSKHVLLFVLAGLAPLGAPIVILTLGVLVCFVQAFVFVLLSTLYLSGAAEEAH